MKVNIGLSADSKTAYVAIDPEALPGGATNVLTDIEFGTASDKVDSNGANHVIYHNVQEALYHEGIEDMQSITITKVGNAWDQTGVEITPLATLDVSNGDTATLVLKYLPSYAAAINSHFDFVSSVPAKATVNSAGLVTAVAAGTTVITATHKQTGVTGSLTVTVQA